MLRENPDALKAQTTQPEEPFESFDFDAGATMQPATLSLLQSLIAKSNDPQLKYFDYQQLLMNASDNQQLFKKQLQELLGHPSISNPVVINIARESFNSQILKYEDFAQMVAQHEHLFETCFEDLLKLELEQWSTKHNSPVLMKAMTTTKNKVPLILGVTDPNLITKLLMKRPLRE